MNRYKNLAVALAVGMPLAATAYVGWVYYSARVEFADRGPPVPPPDPNAPPPATWDFTPVDPADLYGTWTSRAELGSGAKLNRRESVLTFEPGGRLVWTSRATVGTAPPIETVERYDYTYNPGPVLTLSLTERSVNGKRFESQDRARTLMFWRLDWAADDRTAFQLRTDPNDPGRPHLLFRKATGKGWRLFGWDVPPSAPRSAVKPPARR